MKHFPFIFGLLLCGSAGLAANRTAPAPVGPPPILLKPASTGVYTDARGGSHPWSVGQAHILTWDGSPYLPVGAAFAPLSWGASAGEGSWDKDRAALDLLNARGVHDVVLTAGARGLTAVPPRSVQRVLDYLDSRRMGYGLRIADVTQNPLIGYVVKPAVYRNPSPSTAGPTRFRHIPGLAGGFYLLVSPRDHDGEIEESGDAQAVDGETAQVTLKSPVTDDVLLLYPQRVYLPGTPESRLPDLWQGYDEYRDRLLTFFGRVRLGPGFRFFLDPLTDNLGFGGEIENVIPTTDGYRLDFQAWLDKKYNHNVDDLNQGWGIKEKDLPDFTVAARSLPLWSGSKGVAALYDPLKKTSYAVLNRPRIGGHVWDDLRQFRLDSVRGYMNALADVLKKGVADVPVVYGWGGRSALFTNTQTRGGFDGLTAGDVGSSAYAFAQAEDTPRTTWLIAAQIGGAARPTQTADWDALTDEGVRGFFAPAASADAAKRLGDYGAALSFRADELSNRPRVLPYPAGVADVEAGLRRLADGVWWLPSYRAGALFGAGDAFTLGPGLRGYRLNDPDGGLPRFVVWSPHGTLAQAKFPFGKNAPAVITDAAGLPLSVDKNKDTWTVPLSGDPIVISHVATVPLPTDAADVAEKEAIRLLALAKGQGLDVDFYSERLFQIRNTIPDIDRNADLRYNQFARLVGDMTQSLQPFLWIEGEAASSYTFDSLVSDSEASGDSYLTLDTSLPPPSSTGDAQSGYRAEYRFTAGASGSYALWVAGTPPADASPYTFELDGGAANPAQNAPEGGLYAGGFVWNHAGDLTLTRGPHTLTLVLAGPRPRDGRYVLSIDTLCLSRVPFHPNGTQIPAIELLPPADAQDRPVKRKRGR